MTKRLPQLAYEWRIPLLIMLQQAKEAKCGYNPSRDEIETLKRKIGDYYSLTEEQIRRIEDFFKTDEARPYIKAISFLLPEMNEADASSCLDDISKKLFDAMKDEELKKLIRVYTIKQAILNLGVVNIHRTSSGTPNLEDLLPVKLDPEVLRNSIRASFIRIIETYQTINEDFGRLKEQLFQKYSKLVSYSKSGEKNG